jgi:TatD DNase family protein
MIDTHCHLDTEAFDADRDEVLARAAAAGVLGILVPSIRPRTWHALAETVTGTVAVPVRTAVGIHPQLVPELDPGEVGDDVVAQILAGLRGAGSAAVAVGECGLDGGIGDMELQETLFRAHIRAAREAKLPLVIHVLRAHDAAPRILREEGAHEVGGVLHSYSGGEQLVSIYRDLGMSFSFAGPITYPNARRPIEAARAIPAELLLAETDSPDQAPAAHRGQRNEPAFIADVIAGLAAARGVTVEDMAALTTANARRLFGHFGVDSAPG